MPTIITHYLFAKACMDTLSGNEVLASIEQHGDAFCLGAQGPDILFFALGHTAMNRLGGRMHHEGINRFFAESINYVRKKTANEGRNELIAYMAGFMCHYALDTCTHPYIYYKTGFSGEDGRLSKGSQERHHFLETTIDCILSEKLEDKNPYFLNISEKITVKPKKRALIGQFLSDTVNAGYGLPIYPEYYIKAMKDTAFVYRVLHDKDGVRKKVLGAAGKVIGGAAVAASMIHYEPVLPLDYLNEQHATWHYPWDNTIDLYFSFMDLFNKAVDDGRIYINAFMNALNKKLDDKKALSILGDKNFSTGLESPVDFLYYNIEFNKLIRE